MSKDYSKYFLAALPKDEISYRRGNKIVTLTATLSAGSVDIADDHDVILTIQTTDFIIYAPDLSSLGEPRFDDRITFEEQEYEVIKPSFKILDPRGRIIKIHSQLRS